MSDDRRGRATAAEGFSRLLEAAKAGEARALATLWTRHEPALSGLVRRRLSPELRRLYDTSDITQSVFHEVLRGAPRLRDLGAQAFRHLLYVKAESKVRQKFRRHLRPQRPGRRPASDDRVDPVLASVLRRESSSRTRAALGALDDMTAEVVRLRVSEGGTFASIAMRLSLAGADAARKRFDRGLRRLQRTLRKESKP